MIRTCPACNHTGELTWRDGKYHCAMCDHEVSEKEPVVQPRYNTTNYDAVCPICKNRENNVYDGGKYRCALCGTSFIPSQENTVPSYAQFSGIGTNRAQQIESLKKIRNRNLVVGVIVVFLFWPVSIYFFYKAYKTGKELKAIQY